MVWQQLRGHQAVREMLRGAVQRGRISHAYLFVGPEGIGKRLFARCLAQSLFCQRIDDALLDACGECPGCRQFLAGNHPDLTEVGLPEGKRELPLELFLGRKEHRGQEGMCYELSLRPNIASRRIAIIDDAHLLNTESANALLKTIEEPPGGALLILIATTIDAMLPTIRSRCQTVRFSPLSTEDVRDLLLSLGWEKDQQAAAEIASLSEGSMTVAHTLIEPAIRQLREQVSKSMRSPSFNRVDTVAALLEQLEEIGDGPAQREGARWVIKFCAEELRRELGQIASRPRTQKASGEDTFVQDALALERLGLLLERCALSIGQLEQSVQVPLALEGLFDEVGRQKRLAVGK